MPFYKEYLEANTGNSSGIEDPNTDTSVSDGVWQDSLIRWKLKVIDWTAQNKNLPKDQKSAKEMEEQLLPLTLNDSTTVGEIVEVLNPSLSILKIQDPPCFAFLHTDRYNLFCILIKRKGLSQE